jgi:hypothetical protein
VEKGRIASSGAPEGEYHGLGITEGNGEYFSVFDCRVESYDKNSESSRPDSMAV